MRPAAIVLAAGSGSRLGGVAKAALRLPDGRTYIEAIAETARAAGCARVIVVAAEPHRVATEAAAHAAGCEIAHNLRPERGMASSLVVGLEQLDPAAVGVALDWPVDHPAVRTETVVAILAAASRNRIVVPRYGQRGGHPTAFGAELWPDLVAAVDLPGGARNVLERHAAAVESLTVDDPGVVLDVDTPADL